MNDLVFAHVIGHKQGGSEQATVAPTSSILSKAIIRFSHTFFTTTRLLKVVK